MKLDRIKIARWQKAIREFKEEFPAFVEDIAERSGCDTISWGRYAGFTYMGIAATDLQYLLFFATQRPFTFAGEKCSEFLDLLASYLLEDDLIEYLDD